MELPALSIEPHPLLHLRALVAELPEGAMAAPTPEAIARLLALAPAPGLTPLAPPDDAVRSEIRGLLRHGGFKPTGRSKPCPEYLLREVGEGPIRSINPAVDLGNVVALHSGLPVCIFDLDRLAPPLRVAIAGEGEGYPFNASGQVIDLAGLLCLYDGEGPCGNAVKDAQRTKTDVSTRRLLCLLWGCVSQRARTDAAAQWALELLRSLEGESAFLA